MSVESPMTCSPATPSAETPGPSAPGSAPRPLYPAEWIILCLFAFVLPLAEAPKNIFLAVLILLWVGNSLRHRQAGGAWCGWDSVFSVFLAAAGIVVALSSPFPPQWGEFGDVFRYIALAWILSRSSLSRRQILILFAVTLAATLIALAYGYWNWKIAGKTVYLELHSVGHVNHSAIYLAVIAVGVFCWGLVSRTHAPGYQRWLPWLAFLPIAGSLLTGESRGALIACVAGIALFGAFYAHRMRLPLWPALAALTLVPVAMFVFKPRIIEKTVEQVSSGQGGSYRVQLMHTAIEAWRAHPLTGIGPANFKRIKAEQVEAWRQARREPYVAADYFFSGHGHSLYFNTLAERGLVGIAALLLLLAAWGRALMRTLPERSAAATTWLVWGSGAGAFAVTVGGGVFNTTLHHEHGLLCTLTLGLILSSCPAADSPEHGPAAA